LRYAYGTDVGGGFVLIFLWSCVSSSADSSAADDSSSTRPPPGTAVAFDEILHGEASGPDGTKFEPCVTAFVEALSSEAELKSISWLAHLDVPSVDWKSKSMLVAYIDMCTMGKNDLEMTDVWDTGGGTLQVDLTFHRGVFGTAEVVRPFSIATVAKGDYVATANVTVSHDDTGFGSRD
jgi:hypothetical protein